MGRAAVEHGSLDLTNTCADPADGISRFRPSVHNLKRLLARLRTLTDYPGCAQTSRVYVRELSPLLDVEKKQWGKLEKARRADIIDDTIVSLK